MNCEEVGHLLDAYLDRELQAGQEGLLEQHLSGCPACQSLLWEFREFRSFFKANAPHYSAPAQLRTKILTELQRKRTNRAFSRQPGVYAVATLILGIGLLTALLPDQGKGLSIQAVQRYNESLAASRLVGIASADPQTLKPWFMEKINFAPPVGDLLAAKYTLLGGRTDLIQNRSVAALIYRHDNGIITLFCWPPTREQLVTGNHSIEGCNVYTWSSPECNYIVVSKLDQRELGAFVDATRDRAEYRNSGN
jgi:anti-sigma factor RsiW